MQRQDDMRPARQAREAHKRRRPGATAPLAAVLLILAAAPPSASAATSVAKVRPAEAVTVEVPRVVAVARDGKPGPFEVKATFRNTGAKPLRALAARVALPEGLTLARGKQGVDLGTIRAGRTATASWRVQARGACEDRTYKIAVTARARDAGRQTLRGRGAPRIAAPALARTATTIVHGTCARVYGLLTLVDAKGIRPVTGARVALCDAKLAGCTTMKTDRQGRYEFHKALRAGKTTLGVRIRAFGKATRTDAAMQTTATLFVRRGGDHRADLGWKDITPLDGHTQMPGSWAQDELPTFNWTQEQPVHIDGCPPGMPGSASYRLIGTEEPGAGVWLGWLPMTHNADGSFDVVIPPVHPHHGHAFLEITLTCGDVTTVSKADIYIDPSGFVYDQNGKPIAGATVILYRYEGATLDFQQLPGGSAVMSPSNQKNPDVTDVTGHFGWDVVPGDYKVRAQKAGCHAPGSTVPYVETATLRIPPPVTDIALVLECQSTPG